MRCQLTRREEGKRREKKEVPYIMKKAALL
jgi:hypothetical protein